MEDIPAALYVVVILATILYKVVKAMDGSRSEDGQTTSGSDAKSASGSGSESGSESGRLSPELEEPWVNIEVEVNVQDDAGKNRSDADRNHPDVDKKVPPIYSLPRGMAADTPRPGSSRYANASAHTVESTSAGYGCTLSHEVSSYVATSKARQKGSVGSTSILSSSSSTLSSSSRPVLDVSDAQDVRRAFILSEIFHRKY